MNNSEEKEFITRCLAGNRGSFEPLVRKYQPSVFALALNMLGCRDEALDIAQETFVLAFIHLHRYDPDRKFKTWILTIASRRCLDQLRKKRSFHNYFLRWIRENSNGNHAVNGGHRPLESSEIFYPLIKTMKEKERLALLLRMNEDYSAREIAEVLNCSESTARVHLYNARQKVKKNMLAGENRLGREGKP